MIHIHNISGAYPTARSTVTKLRHITQQQQQRHCLPTQHFIWHFQFHLSSEPSEASSVDFFNFVFAFTNLILMFALILASSWHSDGTDRISGFSDRYGIGGIGKPDRDRIWIGISQTKAHLLDCSRDRESAEMDRAHSTHIHISGSQQTQRTQRKDWTCVNWTSCYFPLLNSSLQTSLGILGIHVRRK